MTEHDPTDRPNSSTASSRRRFLQASGVSAAALLTAGCLGEQSGETTTTTSTAGTNDATTTSAAETTAGQSIEEWRAEMKAQARQELQGDEKLQVWAQSATEKKAFEKVFNGYPASDSILFEDAPIIDEGEPWEPLKDNVEVTALGTTKQAQTYRRQVKSDAVQQDILSTAYLPQLVKQDVPIMDLAAIPAWEKHVPERLRNLTSKVAYYRGKAASVVYNTETVSEPPEDLSDLLEDRFGDGNLILDVTPSPIVAYPFVEKYVDSVPPHLEAAGLDMTGMEFLDAIGQQDPTLDRSAYGMQQAVGKGQADAALFGPLTVTYDLQSEGLPLKPMEHPSGHILRPKGMGVAHNPPHPAASKLYIDYILSNPSVQLFERGGLSVDYQKANPKAAADFIYADWQEPYAIMEIETSTKQIREKWRNAMDVPAV